MQRKNGDKAQRAPGERLARRGLRASINSDFCATGQRSNEPNRGIGVNRSQLTAASFAPRAKPIRSTGKQPKRSL